MNATTLPDDAGGLVIRWIEENYKTHTVHSGYYIVGKECAVMIGTNHCEICARVTGTTIASLHYSDPKLYDTLRKHLDGDA